MYIDDKINLSECFTSADVADVLEAANVPQDSFIRTMCLLAYLKLETSQRYSAEYAYTPSYDDLVQSVVNVNRRGQHLLTQRGGTKLQLAERIPLPEPKPWQLTAITDFNGNAKACESSVARLSRKVYIIVLYHGVQMLVGFADATSNTQIEEFVHTSIVVEIERSDGSKLKVYTRNSVYSFVTAI